jgi:NitT/TauT family transport system substrate-binding protein
MSRRAMITTALLALAALVAIGLSVVQRQTTPSGNKTAVTVAQTGDFLLYSGLYVAKDGGFFEKHNLDVAITNTGGDEKSVAAVLAGSANFGVGDPTFAAIAKARGQDVRFVASLVNGVPFWGVTYDPAVVRSYAETGLRNLTVATFPAPSTAYTLQREQFQRAGLEPSIKEGAFGTLAGILEKKEAQIALELEPNVSIAQQNGAVVLYSLSDQYPRFAITGVTVRGDYATKNPQTVQAFSAALFDAYQYIRSNHDKTVDLLAKRFPELPRKVVSDALNRMIAANVIPDTPVTDKASWLEAIKLRRAVGDIKPADVQKAESALDTSFATASVAK